MKHIDTILITGVILLTSFPTKIDPELNSNPKKEKPKVEVAAQQPKILTNAYCPLQNPTFEQYTTIITFKIKGEYTDKELRHVLQYIFTTSELYNLKLEYVEDTTKNADFDVNMRDLQTRQDLNTFITKLSKYVP